VIRRPSVDLQLEEFHHSWTGNGKGKRWTGDSVHILTHGKVPMEKMMRNKVEKRHILRRCGPINITVPVNMLVNVIVCVQFWN